MNVQPSVKRRGSKGYFTRRKGKLVFIGTNADGSVIGRTKTRQG
ncbi:MAG TPA: hypothetical protein VFO38_06220 [Candidatus Saccharimonadales bacterium]|nr:hypothetical protein [Candidatus Saccharimonadales bacterium]